MFGEDGTVLAIVIVAMTVGGLVKGVIGVGLPMVSIAILSSVLDVRLALGIITIWIPLLQPLPPDCCQGIRSWPCTEATRVGCATSSTSSEITPTSRRRWR